MKRIKLFLISLVYKRANLILVDGKDLYDELTKNGVNGRKIRICYAGVDTALFRPLEDADRFKEMLQSKGISLVPGKPVVLYCSRLSHENSPDLFLKVIEGVPGIQAVVAGDGYLRTRLEEEAARLPVPVYFTGSIPYEQLPLIFSHVDICAYTYSEHIGGISQIIPLSMACGAVVITTDTGDNASLISHGKDGFIAKTGDADDIRKQLTEILSGDIDVQKIKHSARETIETKWSIETRNREYKDIIDTL